MMGVLSRFIMVVLLVKFIFWQSPRAPGTHTCHWP